MTLRRCIILISGLLAGCGAAGSAAVCPDAGTALTYDNFGAGFMSVYCVRCHGPALQEKNLRLETVALVRTNARAGLAYAGTGTSMPPADAAIPSVEDRAKLTQWLACGAP